MIDGDVWGVGRVADVAQISRLGMCVDAAQQHEHYGSKK